MNIKTDNDVVRPFSPPFAGHISLEISVADHHRSITLFIHKADLGQFLGWKKLGKSLCQSYRFETNSHTGPLKYHHVIFVDLGLVVLLGLDLLLDVGEDLVLASPLLGGLLYQRTFALLARLQGGQDSIKCVRWLEHLKDVSKVVEIVI